MVYHGKPQGFGSQSLLVNSNNPPQGFFGESISPPPPVVGDPLLAIFPRLADDTYSNYKFYQTEEPEGELGYEWEILDGVGAGIFLESSGFDIRAYTDTVDNISAAVNAGDSFDPQFATNTIILCFILSDDRTRLFCIQRDAELIHEWVLSAPGVLPANGTPSDFTFDISADETVGQDMYISKDGNFMFLIGTGSDAIHKYSLPTPFSISTTPILVDTFSVLDAGNNPTSIDFSEDEMIMIFNIVTGDSLNQYNLTAKLELPVTGTLPDRIFPFNPPLIQAFGGTRYSEDGMTLYISSVTPDQINQYKLDSPFEIPIVNRDPDFFLNTTPLSIIDPRAITISSDEKVIYVTDTNNHTVSKIFVPNIPLNYEILSIDPIDGVFQIKVSSPTLTRLAFIQLTFGNATATDGSTVVSEPVPISVSNDTPLFTKDEDNFLVDDQNRNIVAVQT